MIANGNRVSLEYTLTLDDGTVVRTTVGADPFVAVCLLLNVRVNYLGRLLEF